MKSRDEATEGNEGRGGVLRANFPLLSVGLAIVWITSQLVVEIGFADRLDQAESEFGQSVEYFIEHPMLRIGPRMLPVLRDSMPGYEGNELFSFLSKQASGSEGPSPQEVLDEKVKNAFGLLDSHPHRQLGVVPAAVKPYTYASYAFVHAGWMHMLASLLLLLMAGPLLERTFGRGAFAMLCLVVGVGSSALYAYAFSSSDKPLLGGTVIAIGMVSALIARFRNESVDFAEWLSPWLDVEMRTPAWVAAIPAGVFIAATSLLAEGDLPPCLGIDPGPAAYAIAAVFGASIAFAYSMNGVEKNFGSAPRAQPNLAPRRLDMRRVERAREAGDLDTAYTLLHAEAKRSPGNRNAVLAYWDLAAEVCRVEEGVPIVFQLVREEVRRGAVDVAASHWCRVVDVAGDAHLEGKTLVGLLPWILKSGGADKTLLALEHLMQRGMEGKDELSPHALAEIAFTAADIAPDIAEQAARSALEGTGLSGERRAEVEALRVRLAPKEDETPKFQTPRGELPENAFYVGQDRSEFATDSSDLGGLLPDELGNMPPEPTRTPKFSSVKVVEAVPRGLEPEALTLSVNGGGEVRLAYSRICGVTIAGVGGLAPKPIVVVDLLLSVADPDDLPLEVVRLRGDQFDPRRFVDGEGSPLAALRAFVGQLLLRSGGEAVPSDSILDPAAKVLMFETEEEYRREVLGVGT